MKGINQGKPWSQQDDDDLRLEVSAGLTDRSLKQLQKRSSQLRRSDCQ
jgi:hypothetical protein